MTGLSVIHRPKHDKPAGRDIANEPEMIELKRMIRAGELDAGRTTRHLKGVTMKTKTKPTIPLKLLTIRLPVDVHRALKVAVAEEGKGMGEVIEGLVRKWLVGGKRS